MKTSLKLTGKALLASLLLAGGVAIADSGDDGIYKNMTLEERLYLYDGYGSKWGLDAGNDGLWIVPERPIGDTYGAPLKIRNAAAENTLVVGNVDDNSTGTVTNIGAGNVGIGTDTPTTKVHVVSKFSSSAQIVTELIALDVDNTDATGYSDTGFKLVNSKESVAWTFRTLEADSKAKGNTNSFAISKKNSGGKELILTGKDAEHGNMLILANGAWCDGVWHNTSSRSMKKDIKPLSTKAALEAFSKLQPVTYAYKSNPSDQKVGFIAEDVPELVADPNHKSLSSMDMVAVLTKVVQEQENKIEALEVRQEEIVVLRQKLSAVESLLTNLALNTSHSDKEKLSLK